MITQSEIRKLPTKPSSYKRGCGNGLFVWVTKTYQGTDNKQYGGKKYFKGRYKDSEIQIGVFGTRYGCLLYTSPSPRDKRQSRMPSSA